MNATGCNSFGMDDEGGQARVSGRAMSRLAKAFVLSMSLIGLAAWGGNANAATRFSVASGNRSTTRPTTIWGTACGGAGGVAGDRNFVERVISVKMGR